MTRRSGFGFNGSGIDFRNNFPANLNARNQERADPTTYQFNLPSTDRPTDVSIPETWYPGIRNYWSIGTTPRHVHPIDGIKAVVIHPTAGASSEGAISVMREGKASFHWLVSDENEP